MGPLHHRSVVRERDSRLTGPSRNVHPHRGQIHRERTQRAVRWDRLAVERRTVHGSEATPGHFMRGGLGMSVSTKLTASSGAAFSILFAGCAAPLPNTNQVGNVEYVSTSLAAGTTEARDANQGDEAGLLCKRPGFRPSGASGQRKAVRIQLVVSRRFVEPRRCRLPRQRPWQASASADARHIFHDRRGVRSAPIMGVLSAIRGKTRSAPRKDQETLPTTLTPPAGWRVRPDERGEHEG